MKKEELIKLYPLDWPQEKIQLFRSKLLNWYDLQGRDLPWRQTNNPYYIWVSEIMLQQTQVVTVIPYYLRFIESLPSIKDLSEVDEETLMGLWQGLGYYSRVRNMQTAAKQIMTDFNGQMPKNLEDLLSLKGIGPYTAGAIASIAFNLVEPALDGNLMRIVARLFEIGEDISLAATKKKFMAILYQLIDPERPGDFNQALMDIGATIMTPSNGNPIDSPIKEFDQSYQNGTSLLYPVKKKKVKVTEHNWLAYAIKNTKGEWLMRRHTERELLNGLWHFPLLEVSMVMEGVTTDELLDPFQAEYGQAFHVDSLADYSKIIGIKSAYELLPSFPSVKHVFSHRKWHVQIIPIQLEADFDLATEELEWLTIDQLETRAMSSLQQKLFKEIMMDRN